MTAIVARRGRIRRPLLVMTRGVMSAALTFAAGAVLLAFWAGHAMGKRGPDKPPERIVLVVETHNKAPPVLVPHAPVPTAAPVAVAVAHASTVAAAPVATAPPVAAVEPAPVAPPVEVTEKREIEIHRTAPGSGFGLQVGAFASEKEALAFVAENARDIDRLPVYVIPTEIAGRGTWYRVRLGKARSKAAADALRERLAPALAERAIVVAHK